jgi:hypothetical protein
MPEQPVNFVRFLKSPHHAWLAGLTLGLGFLSAHPAIFALGAALYLLGLIYMPDMAFFKNWLKQKDDAVNAQISCQAARAFLTRRDNLLAGLSPDRSRRYYEIAAICNDIERVSRDSAQNAELDPRLRKLDELMWTYLRLLVLESSLDQFLQTEKQENIPQSIAAGKAEIDQLDAEIKAAVAKSETPSAKIRLTESRKERLSALTKRQDRVNEATDNLTLVKAEQDRLVDQIKLLRADAVAARNAENLTARIDATVENLSQTNKLFAEMDQFKDLVSEDLPQTTERLGFTPPVPEPPPIIRGRQSIGTRR